MTERQKGTILTYAKNDMNLSRTAREFGYDRRTIDYVLQEVKRETGLNPWSFYDLIELLKLSDGWEEETGKPIRFAREKDERCDTEKKRNQYKKGSIAWTLLNGDWSDLNVRQIAEVLGVETKKIYSTINNIRIRKGYEVPHVCVRPRKGGHDGGERISKTAEKVEETAQNEPKSAE